MSNAVVIRKNIENLSSGDLSAVRAAYQKMQALNDNRGFNNIAGFHGVPGHYCHNEDPYVTFLPWHRAYVYWFEQYLRDQDATLGVPYWDWTSKSTHTNGVPAAFSETIAPSGNPLAQSRIQTPGVDRNTQRSPLPPSRLDDLDIQVTQARIDELLLIDDFLDFTEDLENMPHNSLHGWVSGDMGATNFAAFDPIFFSHHCMIDRIWQKWQERHGMDNIPDDLKTRTLAPFGLVVQDVLDASKLGYTYDA